MGHPPFMLVDLCPDSPLMVLVPSHIIPENQFRIQKTQNSIVIMRGSLTCFWRQ